MDAVKGRPTVAATRRRKNGTAPRSRVPGLAIGTAWKSAGDTAEAGLRRTWSSGGGGEGMLSSAGAAAGAGLLSARGSAAGFGTGLLSAPDETAAGGGVG